MITRGGGGVKILSCTQNLNFSCQLCVLIRGNAIKTPTGLVWVVSDRFMQAGSDPQT